MKTIAPAIPSRRLELSWEPELRLPLPCVYGPLDYKELRAQFEQIDRLLSAGGVEARFVRMADEARTHRDEATRKLYARTSALALRCNVARKLLGISFRHFVTQIAHIIFGDSMPPPLRQCLDGDAFIRCPTRICWVIRSPPRRAAC